MKTGRQVAGRVESTWAALESEVRARVVDGSFEALRCISFGKYSNAMLLGGEPHKGDPGLVSEGRREHSQEEEEADSSPI